MTIITRSALIHCGKMFGHTAASLSDDLHSIVDGRIVTWAEVIDARRKRQRQRLSLIRQTSERHAYRVWVAYFDQWCMGGWQAFIERGNHDSGSWVCHARKSWAIPILMKAFPLVLPLGSEEHQFEAWKIAFARQYERNSHDGKPRGVAYVWWDGRTLTPISNGKGRAA